MYLNVLVMTFQLLVFLLLNFVFWLFNTVKCVFASPNPVVVDLGDVEQDSANSVTKDIHKSLHEDNEEL